MGRIAWLLAILAMAPSFAQATKTRSFGTDSDVRDWVAARTHTTFVPSELKIASADLDGDGRRDALVYLLAPAFCGSGGCTMYILENRGRAYRMVGHTTITQLPIRVLERRTNGWRDIGVMVSGGGVRESYEALLRFNGKAYPSNPSLQPASKIFRDQSGSILIPALTRE